METFISDHYLFHYRSGSIAERDIVQIAEEQERCFSRICATLEVKYPYKIQYFLMESAAEVGKLYGGDEPINGFAIWGENKIYAVYNDEIQCIGAHEDVHLISFVINAPESAFIVEGLAMFFDETWWGMPNEIWAAYYKQRDESISIQNMMCGDKFYEIDCMVSYPIAGAFTKFLIETFGIHKYVELYKVSGESYPESFDRIFKAPIVEIEHTFWEIIRKVDFDIAAVEESLRQ